MKRYYLDRAKFKFQLKIKGISIEEMTNKLNLTRHTINNWIRKSTTMDNIMLLAYHLGCSVEDLIAED